MKKKKFKEQVEMIREAFGYINRFKNETFVIKINSSLITHPSFPILIADLVLLHRMGIRIILVPGAKQRINEILDTYAIPYEFKNGIRVTTPEAIPFIKMASFDVSNKVMTLLAENNTNAIIGNWVKARSIGVRDGIDYKFSGIVDNIKTDIVLKILEEGMVPIFPTIGWSATGIPYNISSNELAMAISKELQAAKLFFLTDFGGIPVNGFKLSPDAYVTSEGIISQLTVGEAGSLLDQNPSQVQGTVMELLSLGYNACSGNVRRVHIVDGRVEGMLLKEIFSNRGFGTMIYSNQHENIRKMAYNDIPFSLNIMKDAIEEDILISRSPETLKEKLDDFVVYEVDGTIHGCGALHRYPGKIAEVAGIAVDSTYANLGIGKKILSYLIEKATKDKIKKVFVLTTQASDWFQDIGFKESTIDDLPVQRKKTYNRKRKSRVLIYTISKARRSKILSSE